MYAYNEKKREAMVAEMSPDGKGVGNPALQRS